MITLKFSVAAAVRPEPALTMSRPPSMCRESLPVAGRAGGTCDSFWQAVKAMSITPRSNAPGIFLLYIE
jgi:hypothetical protein